MKLLDVLIERKAQALDRPFSYSYSGNENVVVGSRVLINFANSEIVGFVVEIHDIDKSLNEYEEEMGYKINEVLKIIDSKPIISAELFETAKLISKKYFCPLISVLQCMLPPSLKPASSSKNAPKIAYDIYVHLLNENIKTTSESQKKIIDDLKIHGDILKSSIKSKSSLEKLKSIGAISYVNIEKNRLHLDEYEIDELHELTEQQNTALNSILNTDKVVTLLQGVTGSGKTEIYLALADKYLALNKTILILVPEIALTPLMIRHFQERFSKKIAILHSELTDAQRYDEYRKISSGEASIVIGARSAIFAPLSNIGLIIIDEEHSSTYKQDACIPYYHAKDVALIRANYYNAKVVLGSATPSIDSKARAEKGFYNYACLSERYNKKDLPLSTIVDMSKGYNISPNSLIFSKLLIQKMTETLERNEQIILLLNRRGYSNSLTCRSCGHLFKCTKCNISLTYHKESNKLVCHHCGHTETSPTYCPECGSKYFMKGGFGTERVVNELNKLFPNKTVVQLDSDSSNKNHNTNKILSMFARQEAHILVGTQMVAKGHDFPNVTLVGVLSADTTLNIPSFRSNEETFQLIAQAVGRGGRANKEGEAVIQTFNPNHYAIKYAALQNYELFYKTELNNRKMTLYPPFTHLISMEVSGKDEEEVNQTAISILNNIKSNKFESVIVLGPSNAFIYSKNNTYHKLILIKYKKSDNILKYLNALLNSFKNQNKINIRLNVDPLNC